ncbi:MAG: ABC transporter substrate-binding protein [Erysipelotrichales bacterium]
MKKAVRLMVVALILLVGVGCAAKDEQGKGSIKIGIIQQMEHGSLDRVRTGFIEQLKKDGYVEGENLEIDYQNAQGDQANLKTISSKLVKDSDLILAIGTQAAQVVANEKSEVPILFSAVSDPVDAGLVKSMEKPGGNISGTSDMVSLKAQIDLLKKADPKAKTLGLIYNASEANSKIQIDSAKKYALEIGMKVEEVNAPTTNDIKLAMETLVKKVDVIYVPSDNVLASGASVVGEVSKASKVPVVCASQAQAEEGGLASLGVDYTNLGKQTATMAVSVLKDNKKPIDLAVETSKGSLYINEEMAKALGIDSKSLK